MLRGAEVVEVVQAEPFGVADALEERRPVVGVGAGFAEQEGRGVGGEEGEPFAARDQG